MCPQPSNRSKLVEGALRCLQRLPAGKVTARVIAEESGANLASITYHFGSKETLVTEAVILGLDRWLLEIAAELGELEDTAPGERMSRAAEVIGHSRSRNVGLARNLVGALAIAQHDVEVRERLARGFERSRPNVALLLGLGDDEAGRDAAGLVLSMFHGLLFQVLLDPALAIEGHRMERAQQRLARVLPTERTAPAPTVGVRRVQDGQ